MEIPQLLVDQVVDVHVVEVVRIPQCEDDTRDS